MPVDVLNIHRPVRRLHEFLLVDAGQRQPLLVALDEMADPHFRQIAGKNVPQNQLRMGADGRIDQHRQRLSAFFPAPAGNVGGKSVRQDEGELAVPFEHLRGDLIHGAVRSEQVDPQGVQTAQGVQKFPRRRPSVAVRHQNVDPRRCVDVEEVPHGERHDQDEDRRHDKEHPDGMDVPADDQELFFQDPEDSVQGSLNASFVRFRNRSSRFLRPNVMSRISTCSRSKRLKSCAMLARKRSSRSTRMPVGPI